VAIQIKGDGTFAIEYEGKYEGLDVQKPETLISDKASPSFNNFMLRNAEIRSRPAMVFPWPASTLGTGWTVGVSSFLDINGNTHTVAWLGNALYQFNPSLLPANPWVFVGTASPGNMQTNPVSYRSFGNTIYYIDVGFISNGHPQAGGGGGSPPTINPFMGFWDGLTAAPVFTHTFSDASVSQSAAGISLTDSPTVGGSLPGGPTIIGPIAIGGGFLGELNNQLIIANVSIKDQGNGLIYKFPNMIWWSASGLPLQWDPTQNTSAGFNPSNSTTCGLPITALATCCRGLSHSTALQRLLWRKTTSMP
jgi:hypothetical protein